MLRVSGGANVENRACDGAANPYLAMAAQLAAGLDGIDRGPTRASPTGTTSMRCRRRRSPTAGSGRCRRPCLHAVEELTGDDVLRQALGKTPDGDYIDYYASVKRREFLSWHAAVSDSEIDRYLTLF